MGGAHGSEDFTGGIGAQCLQHRAGEEEQTPPSSRPGGYYAKEEQFRKMDKEAAAAGNIDVMNLKVRSRNWIYARSTEPSGSNLKFDKLETQEAV